MIEGRFSSAELQAAVAGIEVSLTRLDDASLRGKLAGFESRLELVACFLPDDEGQEGLLRVAQSSRVRWTMPALPLTNVASIVS